MILNYNENLILYISKWCIKPTLELFIPINFTFHQNAANGLKYIFVDSTNNISRINFTPLANNCLPF